MPQGFSLLLHRLRVLIAETWETVATHEYGADTMFLEMCSTPPPLFFIAEPNINGLQWGWDLLGTMYDKGLAY